MRLLDFLAKCANHHTSWAGPAVKTMKRTTMMIMMINSSSYIFHSTLLYKTSSQ